jgi:cytochrome oxidase Cu insertion factor (SCO1/SenC/PrrC family)
VAILRLGFLRIARISTTLADRVRSAAPLTQGGSKNFWSRALICAMTALVSATSSARDIAVDIPAVTLRDARNQPVALRDELAQPGPVVVQFIFTTCTTICPVLTQLAATAQRELPALRVVSVSIDPDEDTPARLADYAQRHGAGDGWRFLTGDADDIVAVQRAFDAYAGAKMRHLPLSFVRASPGRAWTRLEGAFTAADIVDAARAGDVALGRRLYRDGVLASGDALVARAPGGAVLRGANAACATCHRTSGYGGVEGRAFVPPIDARSLFDAHEPRRVDRFRALYQELLSPEAMTRLRAASARPPYTRATLAVALGDGIDGAGRALEAPMPRYGLDDADHANLAAYLETLSAQPAPGVDDKEIHFATVIAGDVAPARRDAMLAVMRAWLKQRNADVARRIARPPNPAGYEEDLPEANRAWTLDVWTLNGAASTWPAQLETYQRERPAFALLGGLGDGDWRPVHAFCEAQRVPCVFALTDVPASEHGEYSVYLSGGLPLEARTLAAHLVETWHAQRLVEIAPRDAAQRAASAALRAALAGTAVPLPVDVAGGDASTVVVAWGDAAALRELPKRLAAFGAVERVYVSRARAGDAVAAWPAALREKTLLVDRYAPDDALPHAFRARAWLRSHGASGDDEAVRLATYYVMSTVEAALGQLIDRWSRELFVETIEREAELVPNPGPYPALSLGPGQRVAAKRCRVVGFEDGVKVSGR